ncbi:autotransporter outer membrane beta-barrel domain-containing protein [Pseudomonas putida]|uniref:autotransporter outer membrane beta-barrel domain-containing protein n=1 Tax=Pseudomonas putida TaxID=303 RepID=UPI00383B422D
MKKLSVSGRLPFNSISNKANFMGIKRPVARTRISLQSLCISAVAFQLALACSSAAIAGEVGEGESKVVDKDTPVESWTARGGHLDIVEGGRTLGVSLLSSTGTFQGAHIENSTGAGLRLARFNNIGPSSATVVNSSISGVGNGVQLSRGSQIVLSNTHVYGADNGASGFLGGGIGLALFDGHATVANGSRIVGDKNGVVLSPDSGTGAGQQTASLVLDGSHARGVNGSAIVVGSFRDDLPVTATLTIRNGATLEGGNGTLVEVANNSTANVTVQNTGLEGNFDVGNGSTLDLAMSSATLKGDINIAEGGNGKVALRDNAILTGNLSNVQSLSLDSGSIWNMTQSTRVGDVSMAGGTVNVGGSDGAFRTLTLASLSGTGSFGLGTDLGAGQGDFLDVTGKATGNHELAVRNTGVDPQEGAGPLTLVRIGEGDAAFSLRGEQVDFGTFAYTLEKDGNEWRLVQKPGVVTPGTQSVLGLFSAAPTVWYGELSTLRSRMGELRLGNGQGGGWVRSYGNKYNASAASGVSFSQRQHGISFGADAPLPSRDGQWLVGVMGGYSKSDLGFKGGTSGEVDSFYLGLYSTWLADNGYYIDAVLKANRFQNTSDVRMSDGQKAGGDYDHYGFGGSVEFGKHIELENDWWVEPFAQASTLWVQGQSYDLDNGMRAKSNKADSLQAKLGTHVGKNLQLADGTRLQPYLKIAAAHEFINSNNVKVNDNRFTNDLSGTRGELGVGIAAQVTEDLQLHTEANYSNGSKLEQPWGLNLGLNYRW